MSEALRRRCRLRVRRPSRGGTLLQRVGATAGARRPGAVGRQDTDHPVQSVATGRKKALRGSGLRGAVGQGPPGARSPQAANRPQETPERADALHRVGQGASSATTARACPAAERHTPWVRPLRRSPRACGQPARVLQHSQTDFVKGAQSAASTPPLHLARLPQSTGALHRCPTTDRWTTQDETGSPQALSRLAEARISEEPGARKPHAGICAGAVG